MRIDNNRNKKAFPFQSHELETMKLKMLNWLQPFSIFSYLCTNQNYTTKGTYELLIGLAADDATLYDIESITKLLSNICKDKKIINIGIQNLT